MILRQIRGNQYHLDNHEELKEERWWYWNNGLFENEGINRFFKAEEIISENPVKIKVIPYNAETYK
jgi:hypothetical protein